LNFIIKPVCADNYFYCGIQFYNVNIFLAYLELNHPQNNSQKHPWKIMYQINFKYYITHYLIYKNDVDKVMPNWHDFRLTWQIQVDVSKSCQFGTTSAYEVMPSWYDLPRFCNFFEMDPILEKKAPLGKKNLFSHIAWTR